jgi:hypothetical protein
VHDGGNDAHPSSAYEKPIPHANVSRFISTVLMVFSGGRANGPGNKVPGSPAILSLPWPYQGSQLNLEKNQKTVL